MFEKSTYCDIKGETGLELLKKGFGGALLVARHMSKSDLEQLGYPLYFSFKPA